MTITKTKITLPLVVLIVSLLAFAVLFWRWAAGPALVGMQWSESIEQMLETHYEQVEVNWAHSFNQEHGRMQVRFLAKVNDQHKPEVTEKLNAKLEEKRNAYRDSIWAFAMPYLPGSSMIEAHYE